MVAALCGTALSVPSLWWVVPTAVASFVAGLRPEPASRTRQALLAFGVALALGVVAVTLVPDWIARGGRFVAVLVGGALLPWLVGRFVRQYRQLVRAGWERAERLERERALVAEQARLRERARIAQDMHDVLGHDLSLIALSAGALRLAPDLPDRHREAAGELRAQAAVAVEHLGEVVSLLREGGATVSAGSGGAESEEHGVEELVAGASAAGLDVTCRISGPGDAPPGAEPAPPAPVARAVGRVVREALTNAAKHAPAASVAVTVRRGADTTEVCVVNGPSTGGGSRSTAGEGRGLGLLGLDERVRLLGGSLRHGPTEDGGFLVAARLPHHGRPRPLEAEASGEPGGSGRAPGTSRVRGRARRGVRRTLALAVLVPLAALALLGAVLRGWDALLLRDAVLNAEDFARLRVGQERAEIAPLLPERETPHRPNSSVGPPPAGADCSYYALTADPLDDGSGDAYRLCFDDEILVSADVLSP
ncbi:sensor histidine kinase [Streptomyces triticirhizae]|uniref:histidine kinase n=1 Tax=Streptomyces triticirhizae TaxID=2483353 RepID=A0A3M2LRY9_9ACTN|nr:sensor histidine kinase [Streptomyces triticirhizae]